MKREKQQLRMHTLTDERPSPLKFPSVQKINKTIQGEDGTVFAMHQLMSRANIATGNKTFRTLQKITNDQSERKDLQLLAQWTDSMVQQIQLQHFYSITEFYDKMELIYSGSIGQLCQQLSVKCNDYSLLIDKIWSSFTGTVKEIIEKQSRTNRKLEKDNLTNTIKIHEMYQGSMSEKTSRLVEAEKLSKRNVEYAEKLNKENKYLRKKAKKLQGEFTRMSNDMDLLKLQMQDLSKENETLKLFQQVRHLSEGCGSEFEEELYRAKREIFDDFKQVFEEQTKKFEEAYFNKMMELEKNSDDKAERDENLISEEYEEILFKDKCVGNHAEYLDSTVDTGDLIQKEEMFTQTLNQKKKMYDWATQTLPPQTSTQSCEANYALIKRECIPRNKEEQTYLEMSHYPIKAFIDDYYLLYIQKQEIEKKTFLEVFDSIVDKLKFRSTEIFSILRMKEEFHSDDFNQVDQYVQNSYQVFIYLIHDFLDVIRRLKEELIARKIQIYETQIDCKQTNRSKNLVDKKFDLLATKYQLQVKNYNFIEKQFKDASRHIPQYQLDMLKRKALRHKIHLDFPKTQSPNPVIASTNNLNATSAALNPPPQPMQVFSSQQNLLPPLHQNTSPNLLLSINPQKSFGFFPPMTPLDAPETSLAQRASLVELSCDSPETSSPQKPAIALNFFPDKQFEESLSSSEEDVDLSECLNPVKNLLSIEKKLFVSKCPSKNTIVATQTLIQEIQTFRRDKIDNIVTQGTLIKTLSGFVAWCLKYNKFTYPLHVQLYEHFSAENQSQPVNVWLGKVARVVKSLIYFRRKNDTAKLFHSMLVGDLNFQIYLQVLNNIQNPQFSDTGISVLQSSMADFVKGVPKLPQYIDYDAEIAQYLGPMQDLKVQELLLKYSLILQIFSDGAERFTQYQFRLLMLELEPKRDESWILNLFHSECDVEQSSVQYLSFQRFAILCEELQLLSNLEEYLNHNNVQYFKDLDLWKHREIELKLMLIRSHNYDASERDLFVRMYKLHQPQQHIILGRFLERRAKELLLQQYTLECLAPFMLLFEQ